MAKQFIVFALPRSRTAWLASWLCHGGRRRVAHELSLFATSAESWRDLFSQCDGTVETGGTIAATRIIREFPNAKIVLLSRPEDEIRSSFAKAGFSPPSELASQIATIELLKNSGLLHFTSADLDNRLAAKWLWEHLTDEPFDRDWWEFAKSRNVQVDLSHQQMLLSSRRETLLQLAEEICK